MDMQRPAPTARVQTLQMLSTHICRRNLSSGARAAAVQDDTLKYRTARHNPTEVLHR